jgi:undecaprenyl-diphosphatase
MVAARNDRQGGTGQLERLRERGSGWLSGGMVLAGVLRTRVGRREILALATLSASAALLWGFVELAGDVLEGDTRAFDRAVLLSLRHSDDPAETVGPWWLQVAARDVTSLGSMTVLLLVSTLVVAYLIMKRTVRAALLVASSVGGGMALNSGLKQLFERARPDLVPHVIEVHSLSFPSGHSTLSAVTYLAIGALLARIEPRLWLKAYLLGTAMVLVILIGLSRIYLGVHWPTDVLAGWALGAAWAMLCWLVAFHLQRTGSLGSEQTGAGRSEA